MFVDRHGLDPATSPLTIGARLVCRDCGEPKSHYWPEPYSFERR
jgi:hypothetical protein